MDRHTVAQRVKIVEAYYENGRSENAIRALRDCGPHDRLSERSIMNVEHKF